MATTYNRRQIKKRNKQDMVYSEKEKKYTVIKVHLIEESWYSKMQLAIEQNKYQYSTHTDAQKRLAKLPVGSYILHYDEKQESRFYAMKYKCESCNNKDCGSKWARMKSRFNKNEVYIKFKKATKCEITNALKGYITTDTGLK